MGPWDGNTYLKTALNNICGIDDKPTSTTGNVKSINFDDEITITVDAKAYDRDLLDAITGGYVKYGSLYHKEENVKARNKRV